MALEKMTKRFMDIAKLLEAEGLTTLAIDTYRSILASIVDFKYPDARTTKISQLAEKKIIKSVELFESGSYEKSIKKMKGAIELLLADEDFSKPPEKMAASNTKCSTMDDKGLEEMEPPKPFVSQIKTTFEDICGFEGLKKQMDEIFLQHELPKKYARPQATKERTAILLFGPPGVGKTVLAMAAAEEYGAPLFLMDPSSVLSMWTGNSEKIIKLYRDAAIEAAQGSRSGKAVIFIDECDSFLSVKGGKQASLSFSNTFLAAMSSPEFANNIVWIATTNLPDMLDKSFKSRFTHYIHVPLPDRQTRKLMLEKGLDTEGIKLQPALFEEILKRTDRYSGREIEKFLRATGEIQMKKIMSASHWKKVKINGNEGWEIAHVDDPDAKACSWKSIDKEIIMNVKVFPDDILRVVKRIKATTEPEDVKKYQDFDMKIHDTIYQQDEVKQKQCTAWNACLLCTCCFCMF